MTPDRTHTFLQTPVGSSTTALGGQAPLVGSTVGSFEVLSLAGVGGMGEVYLARDTRLGRDVALKFLPDELASDPGRRSRFEREARVLATFSHPNIAAIHGLEEANGRLVLVLEYVPGPTLEDRLAKGALGWTEAVAIARQIALALDDAHQKGVVHRDLKPANIKLLPNGQVKVLDFGLAKVVAGDMPTPDLSSHGSSITQSGLILGTPRYMSPEQARGQVVDKRTDIWAFGCVLYEMLTGKVAFSGSTVADTIATVLDREPDWAAVPGSLPPMLPRVIRRCLEKDQATRLRDIGNIPAELDELRQAPTAGTGVTTPSRRHWWLALPAFALVAAAAVYFALGSREAPAAVPESPLANARFLQLTDFDGSEQEGMISPDGRFVAFLSDRAGPADIWLTQPGTGQFVNLTPGPEDELVRDRDSGLDNHGFMGDGSGVWVSPRIGQPMQMIPLLGGPPKPFLGPGTNTVAWAPDGKRVVYATAAPGDPIFVADPSGDAPRRVLVSERGLHNHTPFWSGDGKWIYFLHGRRVSQLDLWRVSPDGGEPERLTNQVAGITSVAPLGPNTFLFTGRAPDYSGPWLWTLELPSGTVRRVTQGVERYTSISASAARGLLVATVTNPIEKLFTVPIGNKEVTDRDERPYAVPSVRAVAPRAVPAGLVYVGGSSGGGLTSFDGTKANEVWRTQDLPLLEAPAVSRDGGRIALVVGDGARRRLAVVNADGSGIRRLTESLDVTGAIDWSPDGAWIVAGGMLDGQGEGLFKVPVTADGPPVTLVRGQAIAPVWSPTQDLIVYLGENVAGSSRLLGVTGDGRPVTLPPTNAAYPSGVALKDPYPRFMPDGRGIVFVRSARNFAHRDFWILDLATGDARQLSRFSSSHPIGAFDVSVDGKSLVYARSDDNGNLVLIDLRSPTASAPAVGR